MQIKETKQIQAKPIVKKQFDVTLEARANRAFGTTQYYILYIIFIYIIGIIIYYISLIL